MVVALRTHQIEAADAVEAAFAEGTCRPLVDACVGAGKSLIYAELARRAIARGERVLICSHVRELVQQNADACRQMGLRVGVNAAALSERTWRAPVISAAVQSVFRHAQSFGPIGLVCIDEAHLVPHAEGGMYRALLRDLGDPRVAGGSGTVFRLQGGSLVEGEDSPFDRVVYRYTIVDGIRDGYLCPAFSIGADDKVDRAKLRTRQGEFTSESSDAQMLALMDNHIAQVVHNSEGRRAWLVFEAGTKAATAMAARMGEWGIPTGLVLGETPAAERAATVEAFRAGRLRAVVNVNALCVGFDVPHVDLLVMRRPTKSLGLYIQQAGRGLRCVGGNISSSIEAGKADCAVLDFAGNIDTHGPLDFIRPKATKSRLVSCEDCGKRNSAAAARCWACDALMTKLCPACLGSVAKGILDCPHCSYDMRTGGTGEVAAAKLLDTPSGAALISAFAKGTARDGGWEPARRVWNDGHIDMDGRRVMLPENLAKAIRGVAPRWIRFDEAGEVVAVLVPNGSSRTSARQIGADGAELLVPMPAAAHSVQAAA